MTKAVFIDYTGTIMREKNKYSIEMAENIAANSSVKNVTEVFKIWWTLIGELENSCYGDKYRTQEWILEKAISILKEKYHYTGNGDALISLAHLFWSKSPAFDDVKDFFEKCHLPIYIITNNGEKYVRIFLEDNGLHCAGIICGDMVNAYKPHKELFLKALQMSGCNASDVVHIGDSMKSDVKGAFGAGIFPILLDRSGSTVFDTCKVAYSLTEILPLVSGEEDISC